MSYHLPFGKESARYQCKFPSTRAFIVSACRARLRIDIRDFRLSQSPLIAPSAKLNDTSSKILDEDNDEQHHFPAGCAVGGTIYDASRGRCVAMSKHLCGVATDLALRCLRNATTDTCRPLAPRHVRISTEQCAPCAAPAHLPMQAEDVEELESTATSTTESVSLAASGDSGSAVRVEGVAIALCCHHCMIWSVRCARCNLRFHCALVFILFVLIKAGAATTGLRRATVFRASAWHWTRWV